MSKGQGFNVTHVVNKISLIGRIGADPTTNEVGDRRVTNYTLATSETRPDKEGTQKIKLIKYRPIKHF